MGNYKLSNNKVQYAFQGQCIRLYDMKIHIDYKVTLR